MFATDTIKVGTFKISASHSYLPKSAIPSDVAEGFKSFIDNKTKIEFCHANVGVSFILQEDVVITDSSYKLCNSTIEYNIEKGSKITLVCVGNEENCSIWQIN